MLWKVLFSLAALSPHNDRKDTEQHVGFVPTAYGPQTAEEDAIAREAMYGEGGDMILPEDFNITEVRDAAIRGDKFRWPGYPGHGRIPYVIHYSAYRAQHNISAAIKQFHRHTCIRFVPRTYEHDYVQFFHGTGCSTDVGRRGGQQNVSVGAGCGYVGMLIHLIGHVIGLFHEHQRSDRDGYVRVLPQNIIPDEDRHFQRTKPELELIFTRYNQDSIMHYGNYAFSIRPNYLPTLLAKNGRRLTEPYQKSGLASSDIYQIRRLYECTRHLPMYSES